MNIFDRIFTRDNHRINKLQKESKKIIDAAGRGNDGVVEFDLIYCDVSDGNHGVMRGITKEGRMYGFSIVGGKMTMVMMRDFAEKKS